MTLTPLELRQLTRVIRSDAQARELEHMGIPYKTRRDGSLAVLRASVEVLFGATMTEPEPEVMP